MLEIEFECKSVRRTSERCNKGGLRVHAVRYPVDNPALSPFCNRGVLLAAMGGLAFTHTLHEQPFAQLYLSAATPGPPAGSA
jgi:hypothetical protein